MNIFVRTSSWLAYQFSIVLICYFREIMHHWMFSRSRLHAFSILGILQFEEILSMDLCIIDYTTYTSDVDQNEKNNPFSRSLLSLFLTFTVAGIATIVSKPLFSVSTKRHDGIFKYCSWIYSVYPTLAPVIPGEFWRDVTREACWESSLLCSALSLLQYCHSDSKNWPGGEGECTQIQMDVTRARMILNR